ncbi:MAG TPA: hypothetical protein PLX23_08125 [Candidatus Hydrogenedens sp.]|nr:hypothetical protein [Candidatus Hydrogenedens sp.]
MAAKSNSVIILPTIYGFSTGIPVILFAFFVSFGTSKIGKAYNFLSVAEIWARQITGVVFILIGIYLSLINIFGINIL